MIGETYVRRHIRGLSRFPFDPFSRQDVGNPNVVDSTSFSHFERLLKEHVDGA